ncbi:hypothetical protein IscW_ISCW010228 [Ixodes scapularis]|uniref:Uncharacterized protein n=1 Tax=Ixodes scapularis TaxID=6945 RepID=B7Q0T0_IXOSC|nr:hypothetical protein IscW_ISCW010228 [Ixodes scapularis]|eukprot:XP_002408291.1 hypothetical protein IscW_ISCW010228 [Ixodes scapularis]
MFCNLRHTGAQGIRALGEESTAWMLQPKALTKSATRAGTSAVFTFGQTCTNDTGTEGRA